MSEDFNVKNKVSRRTVYLDDLIEEYVGEVTNLVDLRIVTVYDTAGNVVSKADELEIVYEVTTEPDVDKSEQTPKEENEWLREAGF